MSVLHCTMALDPTAGDRASYVLRVSSDPEAFRTGGWIVRDLWTVEVYALTDAVVLWLAQISDYDLDRDPPEGIRIEKPTAS